MDDAVRAVRGQPAHVLLFDPGYCFWLLDTPDLMERHPGLHRWLNAKFLIPVKRREYTDRAERVNRSAEIATAVIGRHDDARFRLRDVQPLIEQASGLSSGDARHLLAWLEDHGVIARSGPANRIHFVLTGAEPPRLDGEVLTRQFAEQGDMMDEYWLSAPPEFWETAGGDPRC